MLFQLLQVIHLSLLGGKSLSDVVGRLLRHLMTVALQRQYNWFGHKGKKEFGKLNLAGVVCSKYNCGYYCESTLTVLLAKHIEKF